MKFLRNPKTLLILSYFFIGLVALLPRTLNLGQFITDDEARYWLLRSQAFLTYLQTGNYAATAITAHPGVTTMWLGGLGINLQHLIVDWGWLPSGNFASKLALIRLPVALTNTAGVVLGYSLLRRLLPARMAFFGALLWATDPFVIALGRILHVDGLATTFLSLSLLTACYAWHHSSRKGWFLLSGVAGGLALLSKSSALVLLPTIFLLALATEARKPGPLLRYGKVLPSLLLWGGAFGLTLVLVWPAVWANPWSVYQQLRIGVEVEGGSPHVQGNFFLGHEDDAPGPLFYPVALALRLTPWVMLGLFLLGWGYRSLLLQEGLRKSAFGPDLSAMTGFTLLSIFALSLFEKKLNRYLVIAFPMLDILAAGGLLWGAERLAKILPTWQGKAEAIGKGLLYFVGGAAILNVAYWHPYPITYFNPLLGGHEKGARTFLIGSGEGLEQVAAWLNVQPDITGVVVATTMTPPLQAYLRKGAQALPRKGDKLPEQTGYAVVYVRNVWGKIWPPFDQFYPQTSPLHTVWLHGVEYAWIYQVPPPISQTVEANFGQMIRLRGYTLNSSKVQEKGLLTLTLQWQTSQPLSTNYMLFMHLLNTQGQRVAQVDTSPAGPAAPTKTWLPSRFLTWEHPLPVAKDLAPGTYWLALGLYDLPSANRLPLQAKLPLGAPSDGENTLLLGPFTLP